MKKGVWLEVLGDNPPLKSQEELAEAKKWIVKHSITDVYLQVYREGQAWFKSTLADTSHYEWCLKAHSGKDPIADLLNWSNKLNIKIHFWFNIFNWGSNDPLVQFGPSSLLIDSEGILAKDCEEDPSILKIDAPGHWLDPASKEVQSYHKKLIKECIENYPEVAGVHLDYFRYPYYLPLKPSSAVSIGKDFGYHEDQIERFSKEQAIENPFKLDGRKLIPQSYDISLSWDKWRREQITSYLYDYKKLLSTTQELSVAAVCWPDRAYMCAYQNWRKWLKLDLVDYLLPMIYTADNEMFRQLLVQARAFELQSAKVVAGIGAYIFTKKESLEEQIEIARESGEGSYCLFSYRNMKKRQW